MKILKDVKIGVSLSCYYCGEPASDLTDKSGDGKLDIHYVCGKHRKGKK